jgi:hypothetical protein
VIALAYHWGALEWLTNKIRIAKFIAFQARIATGEDTSPPRNSELGLAAVSCNLAENSRSSTRMAKTILQKPFAPVFPKAGPNLGSTTR